MESQTNSACVWIGFDAAKHQKGKVDMRLISWGQDVSRAGTESMYHEDSGLRVELSLIFRSLLGRYALYQHLKLPLVMEPTFSTLNLSYFPASRFAI